MTKKLNFEEIKYYDAHSHLHSDFFNKKLNGQEVARKMLKKDIFSTLVGVSLSDSKKAIEMAERNDNLYVSIGIHPTEKEEFLEDDFQSLLETSEKIICIGECGLDYYWPSLNLGEGKISQNEFEEEKRRQKILFEKQIDFAVKNNLSLMLHIRSFENADAHWDAFKILDQKQKEHQNKIRADFHFFTEGPEIAKEIIKRKYMISLPGVITFANLDKSILEIPLENIMVETDSPFATPVPHRGKINTPIYVIEVVKKIAEVKSLEEEEVRKKTTKNALKFFSIGI